MQPNNARQETSEQHNQEGGVITALIDSAAQILQRYSTQWDTSKEMLHVEWRITWKSLWFALIALIVFSGVVLSACISLAALVAYGLYAIGAPVWAIGLALIVLHGVMLYTLVLTMRTLIKRMGFNKTFDIFAKTKGEA